MANPPMTTFPSIVQLNVGGTTFTTSLSTLRRYKSMLATMFSGRHEAAKDEHGRYFIDRDPILFRYILDFMRSDILPPTDLFLKVYEEALYPSFDALIDKLTLTKPVAGKIIRDAFLQDVRLKP